MRTDYQCKQSKTHPNEYFVGFFKGIGILVWGQDLQTHRFSLVVWFTYMQKR